MAYFDVKTSLPIEVGEIYNDGTDLWLMNRNGLIRVTNLSAPEISGIADFANGWTVDPVSIKPDDAQADPEITTTNVIPPGAKVVTLAANINGVNDFFVLPSLASVPNGHEIIIIAGAANCEMRTPADSAEEINSEDCDGTKEYLITATTITRVIKIDNTIGWMANGWTAIGAVQTAVVPD